MSFDTNDRNGASELAKILYDLPDHPDDKKCSKVDKVSAEPFIFTVKDEDKVIEQYRVLYEPERPADDDMCYNLNNKNLINHKFKIRDETDANLTIDMILHFNYTLTEEGINNQDLDLAGDGPDKWYYNLTHHRYSNCLMQVMFGIYVPGGDWYVRYDSWYDKVFGYFCFGFLTPR